MNLGKNIETLIVVLSLLVSLAVSLLIMRKNWKRYGLLFMTSAVVGNLLCIIFYQIGFYVYPFRLFPTLSNMPLTEVGIIFPAYVLFGVCFSPQKWAWKIPFYWAIIHVGVLVEALCNIHTRLIEYSSGWDLWDSYTWWWIFLLCFEWMGGVLIPPSDRNPIDSDHFRYGQLGWAVVHFILIVTIFLGGFLVGRVTK